METQSLDNEEELWLKPRINRPIPKGIFEQIDRRKPYEYLRATDFAWEIILDTRTMPIACNIIIIIQRGEQSPHYWKDKSSWPTDCCLENS